MSRIGKQPVALPKGVDFTVADGFINVKGPKGTLQQKLPPGVTVVREGDEAQVSPANDSRQARASWGLMRSLLSNMVTGVNDGYTKKLDIVGTGYRCEAKTLSGLNWLQFSLGYSHPILFEVPDGVTATVEKLTSITVQSIDKQALGQVAAKIRSLRPPEPYKGKGIRYSDERVRRKVGKAGGEVDMGKTSQKLQLRARRQKYIRLRVSGEAVRPRLTIFRSARHIYAQIIDDRAGKTLAAAHSRIADLPKLEGDDAPSGKIALSMQVGLAIAAKAKEAGISQVVFDRAGFKYHGRVKALADGARKGGLDF